MTPVLDQPDATSELPPPPADAQPFGAAPTEPPPTDHAPAPRPRRSGWHIAAIVIGAVMLLPGLGALAGGTGLLVARSVATDDGFFDVTIDRVESDGVAVATVDLWDESSDEGPSWVLDLLDADVRLWVDGSASTDEVFVGIARTRDVEAYLSDVRHSEITDFEDRAPLYRQRFGSTEIDPPTEVDIWDASAAGAGEQVLTWEARGGDWSVVVMNADGSPNVAADVEVGIRSDALTAVAVGMLIVGGLIVIGGTVLIVIGVRGRRDD